MSKAFIVTALVKQQPRGQKEVTLGAYLDKEQAEQAAQASLTTQGGVLCDLITWREANGYDTEIKKIVEGNITKWGKWNEGIDWHTETSFWMGAKVEEVDLK